MDIKQVVLYARVSKLIDQDPENQLQELRRFAELKGWVIVREYVDRSSGAKESRPALGLMMQEIAKGWIDCQAVLVWKVDRLGRSVQHLHNAIAKLKDAGVAFVSTTEGIDLTTPMGEAMFGMLAVMAQFERALIVERTRAGLARVKASGVKLGRPLLTGQVCRATLQQRERRRRGV